MYIFLCFKVKVGCMINSTVCLANPDADICYIKKFSEKLCEGNTTFVCWQFHYYNTIYTN